MTKPMIVALATLSILMLSAKADPGTPQQGVETLRQQGYTVSTITPIFGQLLRTSFPKGFQVVPVFEKVLPGQRYMRETVLEGENANEWTQMITIMGAKDLASNADITPKKFAENIARGYRNACPNSFSAALLAEAKIDGLDSYSAIVSCGTSPLTLGRTSESALIVVLKGEQDYYTVKWSERSAASSTPLAIDTAKWTDRFKMLTPVRLCPRVPGESTPYPSCVDKK
jgi:hypothetical protein